MVDWTAGVERWAGMKIVGSSTEDGDEAELRGS